MNGPVPTEELDRLAGLIEQVTGNVIPRGQYPHLEKVAIEHARAAGFPTLEAYLELLEESGDQEWRRLLPDITIKESYLFRIPEQFRALQEEVLPQLARVRPEEHCLTVWSAGCARGEEAATLAVVMAGCPFLANRRWRILATDVDDQALEAARRGEFGARAVAHVPPYLLRAWFERRGESYVLAPELQGRVEYRHFNFFRSPYLSLGPPFDVIFLRNVLIYFSAESQRRVLERVIRHLAPEGVLFVGHSESLWQLTTELRPQEYDQCFAYRRRPSGNEPRSEPRRPAQAAPRDSRREARPGPPVTAAGSGTEQGSPSPAPDLSKGARALTEDRLDDARAIVDRFLESHRASADAHALSGLVHDLQGASEAAVAAYRAALFLEPGFYEIRFLLAHRFMNLGLPARARHEYRRILSDLKSGKARAVGAELRCLKRLLAPRDEAERWCRRALERT